jgi:hypothetical protein
MVNDASRRSHDFKDELGGKPEWVGVYCERALKLHPSWKGLSGKAKVKTGIGKSDLPGLQGGPRKRDLVSYYMVRAPRLYPDPGNWVRSTRKQSERRWRKRNRRSLRCRGSLR